MNFSAGALLRGVFRTPVLSFRDLRLLGASSIFDAVGSIGENIVLGWIILQLTDSPFMVGAALSARMAPSFFLGVLAGTIADMVDRLFLLRLLNLLLAGLLAGIGLIFYADEIQVWHLFVLPPIGGAISTLHMTLRQSLVYDIVGPSYLVNGLAIVSLGMRAGGLVGALAIGFVLGGLGPDIAYFVMALSYLIAASLLMPVSSRGHVAGGRGQNVGQSLKRFAVELRRNNTLLTLVIMTATVEVFGFSHETLYPSIAEDVLNLGPEGLGIMTAFRSGGGIAALVIVAAIGDRQRKGLAYLVVLLMFGTAVFLLGLGSNLVVVLVTIAAISGMASLSDIYSQSMMQIAVPNELRGRAMGAWVLAAGTGPLGNLQIGALASIFSVGLALSVNGISLIVLALAGLAFLPNIRRQE